MPITEAPEITFVYEGEDVYITADGVKVARRGFCDSAEENSWETLKPGWSVVEDSDGVQIRGPRGEVKLH